MPGAELIVGFLDRRYAVDLLFQIPRPPADLRIFNITARPDHDSEEGLAGMGLYLASRACDQFSIQQLASGSWKIMLRKERSYPPHPAAPATAHEAAATWQIAAVPAPDAVKQLSALIGDAYAALQFPETFTPPGRLLDKLASTEYGVILAQDPQGELAGGLIWRTGGGKVVNASAPTCAVLLRTAPWQQHSAKRLPNSLAAATGSAWCSTPPSNRPPQPASRLPDSLRHPRHGLDRLPDAGTEEFGADAWVPQGCCRSIRNAAPAWS